VIISPFALARASAFPATKHAKEFGRQGLKTALTWGFRTGGFANPSPFPRLMRGTDIPRFSVQRWGI
jgi:hypothetical protein